MANKNVYKPSAKRDDSDTKLFAFLGVFLTVIGYIIVMLARKEDKYAMYYAKQGLILFIAWVIAWVVGWILRLIPFVGNIIGWALNVIVLVLWIIGIIYAISGEEKEIPLIGQFAKNI